MIAKREEASTSPKENSMEFLLFLGEKEKEILDLIYKAQYSLEENTPLCLIGKEFFGFLKKNQKRIVICTNNAKEYTGYSWPRVNKEDVKAKTGIYIRRALRHEAVHVAQACNNGKPVRFDNNKEFKIHPYKIDALQGSAKLSGNKEKEYQAYALEDKPKYVIKALKKYCL